MTKPLKALGDDASDLADAAFDFLMAGETPLTVFGDRGPPLTARWLDEGIAELARFLRTDEPIPPAIRRALANAIDGSGNPPIRFATERGPSTTSIYSIMRGHRRGRIGLEAYERARASGANVTDSKRAATDAACLTWRYLQTLVADARLDRDAAMSAPPYRVDNRTIAEIAAIGSTAFETKRAPRPAGRPRKKTGHT